MFGLKTWNVTKEKIYKLNNSCKEIPKNAVQIGEETKNKKD